MRVLRWGRSAYETPDDLARERDDARHLGYEWYHTEDVVGALSEADVLVVTSGVRVGAEALDRTRCRVVITTTSGYDHVDIALCASRGVAVLRVPEARRDAVIEHALAALLRLQHRLGDLEAYAPRGVWARDRLPELAPIGLSGSGVLVVGLGVIGTRMAEVLRTLGANVVGVDPTALPAGMETGELDDLLPTVDAVTLHCSLTPSSRGLFDASRIGRLRSTAVLVNTARGEVLDVEAAVTAVRDGKLRGLACDVFPVEPYPRIAEGAAVGNVLFTPHAAGFVRDLGARVALGVRQALTALAAGAPLPHRVV